MAAGSSAADGKANGEHAPLAETLALGLDGASVQLDEVANNREPYSEATSCSGLRPDAPG